jgi:biopolymer transport protein ExbB
MKNLLPLTSLAAAFLTFSPALRAEESWWDKAWTQRQKLTIDPSAAGGATGPATLLVRISEPAVFGGAREDGSDIRFVAGDDKTVLPHQVERFDSLLGEAFLWVKIPDLKQESIHLYFGNRAADMPAAGKGTDAYGPELAAVYHFADQGNPPADSTGNANNASSPAATAEVAIIGSGLSLAAGNPVPIPNSDSLAWDPAKPIGISLWLKVTAPQPDAVLLSRSEGNTSFKLSIDQGAPILTIGNGATRRSTPGTALAPGSWSHIAVSSSNGKTDLFVNGEPYASLPAPLPALAAPVTLGGPGGFNGEIDELRLHAAAIDAAAAKFAFINQGGGPDSGKVLAPGAVEGGEAGGGGKMLEHVMLFGDIAKNMMFDGWIAIGICVLMIIVGWTVAIRKFLYLNKIEKGNEEFLELWKTVATDLTVLDNADEKTIRSMGGSIEEEDEDLMRESPLYNIYHIGSVEIRHRLNKLKDRIEGLPGRSIQAIRASLDAGLVRENHKLTDGLVFLTISIAGGPYVGLLGTVVGVMITFAIIAKSGEVNVNSIAPGIASALLATVVGLIVAIPALFIYSYLNARIKNVVSSMQVFIDEFVAKMAEFYRPKTGGDSPD